MCNVFKARAPLKDFPEVLRSFVVSATAGGETAPSAGTSQVKAQAACGGGTGAGRESFIKGGGLSRVIRGRLS